MARPERNNVDYFPFLCKEGKAMFYIEQTYGNDGYATWIKILRQLAVTNYHYLNMNDDIEFMFLASKCRISIEVLTSIINDLCKLNEFDTTLWSEHKIIYSAKFIESISDAYLNRKNKCITFNGLIEHLQGLGIVKHTINPIKSTDNTHTILYYTKKEETIQKEKSDFYIFRLEQLENLNRETYDKLKKDYEITEPIIYTHKNQHPVTEYDLVEHLALAIESDEWKQSLLTRFGKNKKFSKAMVDYFNLLKTNYEYLEFKSTFDFRKYFANWFNTKKENY